MLRKVLLPAALIVTSFPDMPAAIPAALAQTSGGQVCRNFAPNGSFYGYQADLNVDLAGSFSSIDEIYGVATTASGHNILLQKTSPAGSWIDQGYGPSAAGGQYYATGGWLTFNGNPSLPASTSGLDVRFGSADGISPGKTTVPTGTQALYMVDRGSTAISISTLLSAVNRFQVRPAQQPQSTRRTAGPLPPEFRFRCPARLPRSFRFPARTSPWPLSAQIQAKFSRSTTPLVRAFRGPGNSLSR